MQGIFLNVNDITLVLILLQKCRKMRNPGNEVVSPNMSLNPSFSFSPIHGIRILPFDLSLLSRVTCTTEWKSDFLSSLW